MGEPALSPPYTAEEAARLLRVSVWLVGQMTRDGRLPRIPGIRWIRIPRYAVHAMLEGYYAVDGEPNRETSAQTKPSWRRNGTLQANRPLAAEPVGDGGALRGRAGPAAGDVVIRRVET